MPRARTAPAIDEHLANDLRLFLDNDREMHDHKVRSYLPNIARKMISGKYDASKAWKLWMYLVDEATRKYDVEHGSGGTRNAHGRRVGSLAVADKATREAVAKELAAYEESALRDGEYGDLYTVAGRKPPKVTGARSNPRAKTYEVFAHTGETVWTGTAASPEAAMRKFKQARGLGGALFTGAYGVRSARGARKNGGARGKVTMADIKAANAAAGNHWFSRGNNKFFASKVVGGPYGGRYFVTEEKSGFGARSARRYTVREAIDGGANISTVGKFNGHAFKEDAVAEARALAAADRGAHDINAAVRGLR